MPVRADIHLAAGRRTRALQPTFIAAGIGETPLAAGFESGTDSMQQLSCASVLGL